MRKKDKKIIFYTAAWGSYVEMYRKGTAVSVQEDVAKLKKEGYEIESIEAGFNLKETPTKWDPTRGANGSSFVILEGLRKCIQKCIDEEAIMVLLPPDTIFGKGTIYNMVKLSENKPDCIAFPHLRTTKIAIKGRIPTNRELVTSCFESGHTSFTDSFDKEDANATWAGISVRHVSGKTYALTHSLPTVYLAKFTVHDKMFWQNCVDFGAWDRNWLHKLFDENRVKVIGNSDVCFGVELTKSNSNNPEKIPGLKNNDKHFINELHNSAFNKFYCTITKK